jgi:hypothetical protein
MAFSACGTADRPFRTCALLADHRGLSLILNKPSSLYSDLFGKTIQTDHEDADLFSYILCNGSGFAPIGGKNGLIFAINYYNIIMYKYIYVC